jgi:hypothetical protein
MRSTNSRTGMLDRDPQKLNYCMSLKAPISLYAYDQTEDPASGIIHVGIAGHILFVLLSPSHIRVWN